MIRDERTYSEIRNHIVTTLSVSTPTAGLLRKVLTERRVDLPVYIEIRVFQNLGASRVGIAIQTTSKAINLIDLFIFFIESQNFLIIRIIYFFTYGDCTKCLLDSTNSQLSIEFIGTRQQATHVSSPKEPEV